MKQRWVLIGILLLSVPWVMVGCGISQEAYDSVVAQLNTAKNELQSARAELESNIEKGQNELQAVKAELESHQSKVSELTSKLEESQNELQLTQTNLKSTQDELDSIADELATIEKVFPPREFSSATELKEWLRDNDMSERPRASTAEGVYAQALELQEDALKDGYIISVDVDYSESEDLWYIACVTCIDGELWAWGPDSDEPIEISSMIDWVKVK